VSKLQAQDPNYHGVRAFSDVFAFTQAYFEHGLDRDWGMVQSAILSGDDATVERLMEEQVISKVFSTSKSLIGINLDQACRAVKPDRPVVKLAQLRHFMTGLNKMSSRDLKVFLNYISLEGKSEVQYPWTARQWRALRNPRLFEDWARSIIMNDKVKIGWFLVGSQ
jgi:hypothetical protein